MGDSFSASAPGNLMLLGEHAVLRGQWSLICAVNQRLRVELTPRADDRIRLQSALGSLEMSRQALVDAPAFRFVCAAIRRHQPELPSGFDLRIESAFSHQVGLGSSAAVTVSTVAVLAAWLGKAPDPDAVFLESVAVVRAVQGVGSGADVAACVHGGVIAYRADPCAVRRLPHRHPITVVYSGSKLPTVEVIRRVNEAAAAQPEFFNHVFSLMGSSAESAAGAIEQNDWPAVGRLLNLNQSLMEAIGVSNERLAEIIRALHQDPGILGAKISGSGLGDCVVGLGRAAVFHLPYEVLPVDMAAEGLLIHPPPSTSSPR